MSEPKQQTVQLGRDIDLQSSEYVVQVTTMRAVTCMAA